MEMIITIILYLVMLVFGILQIILFFKVWNMTMMFLRFVRC